MPKKRSFGVTKLSFVNEKHAITFLFSFPCDQQKTQRGKVGKGRTLSSWTTIGGIAGRLLATSATPNCRPVKTFSTTQQCLGRTYLKIRDGQLFKQKMRLISFDTCTRVLGAIRTSIRYGCVFPGYENLGPTLTTT